MDVLKNLRSTTARKMFSATMPTKVAAHHSIASMNRSIALRGSAAFGFAAASVVIGLRTRRSKAGLVLRDRRLQRVHRLLGIAARLRDLLGPLSLQRRDRLAPGIGLLGAELVRLVAGQAGELRAAGE